MTDNDNTEAFLAHFGVKGMKWGKRKAADDSSDGDSKGSSKPQKLTRKEVRAEKKAFYEKKADNVIRTAAAKPETLIQTLAYDPVLGMNVKTIMTGKELVEHMGKGGYMNAKYTDIYATKDAKSQNYILNDKINQKYVRSDKKKK